MFPIFIGFGIPEDGIGHMVTFGAEGTFTLEQPSSSLIMRHRRMQQILKIIRVPGLTIWLYTFEDAYAKVILFKLIIRGIQLYRNHSCMRYLGV